MKVDGNDNLAARARALGVNVNNLYKARKQHLRWSSGLDKDLVKAIKTRSDKLPEELLQFIKDCWDHEVTSHAHTHARMHVT